MTNADRHSIETRIYNSARALRKNAATDCYDEDMIEHFLEAWHELVKHYRNNTDTEIGVVIVREYLRWAHTFGAYAQSETVSKHCQEISAEARNELSVFLDDILVAVAETLDLPDQENLSCHPVRPATALPK